MSTRLSTQLACAVVLVSVVSGGVATAGPLGDASLDPPSATPPASPDQVHLYRMRLGQQYQREAGWIALAGGGGILLGGFLFHRGATACERWSEGEDPDDDYLCFISEIGYMSLGTTIGIFGVTGVVAGLIRWRLGDRMEDEAREKMSLSVAPTPGGGTASLTLRF